MLTDYSEANRFPTILVQDNNKLVIKEQLQSISAPKRWKDSWSADYREEGEVLKVEKVLVKEDFQMDQNFFWKMRHVQLQNFKKIAEGAIL